jgi:hypothetical protein
MNSIGSKRVSGGLNLPLYSSRATGNWQPAEPIDYDGLNAA